jgi:hypothetical protein
VTTEQLQTALTQISANTAIRTEGELRTSLFTSLLGAGVDTAAALAVTLRTATLLVALPGVTQPAQPATSTSTTATLSTSDTLIAAAEPTTTATPPLDLSAQVAQQASLELALALLSNLPQPTLRATELDREVSTQVDLLTPASFTTSAAGLRIVAGISDTPTAPIQSVFSSVLEAVLQRGSFTTVRDLRDNVIRSLITRGVPLQDSLLIGSRLSEEIASGRVSQTNLKENALSNDFLQNSLQQTLVTQGNFSTEEAALLAQQVTAQLAASQQYIGTEVALRAFISTNLQAADGNAATAQQVAVTTPLPSNQTGEDILTSIGLVQNLSNRHLGEEIYNAIISRLLAFPIMSKERSQQIADDLTLTLTGQFVDPNNRDIRQLSRPNSILRIIRDTVLFLKQEKNNQALIQLAYDFERQVLPTYQSYVVHAKVMDPTYVFAHFLSDTKGTLSQSISDPRSFQRTTDIPV